MSRKMETQVRDVLRELCNVGIGSSMTALSRIAGREICYTNPGIAGLADHENMETWFQNADDHMVGVSLPFGGELLGMMLLLYDPEMVNVILEPVFGRTPDFKDMESPMTDMVLETANIMASSCLTSMSAYTSWRMTAGRSAVSTDMAGAMLGETASVAASIGGRIFCIGSRFGFMKGSENSCMLIMVDEDSVPGSVGLLEDKNVPDCDKTE